MAKKAMERERAEEESGELCQSYEITDPQYAGLEEVAIQREAILLAEKEDGFAFSRREYLEQMIDDQRFNEAENLLFSYLDEDIQSDSEGSKSVDLVSWFYDTLEVLSDQELEEGNFSREELEEGLQDALDLCFIEEEILDISDLLEF